jgi:hypothetical protein
MNAQRTTNILLLALVLLLAFHEGRALVRPVGRFVWSNAPDISAVLDTTTGKVYGIFGEKWGTLDMVAMAKKKQRQPGSSPVEQPADKPYHE